MFLRGIKSQIQSFQYRTVVGIGQSSNKPNGWRRSIDEFLSCSVIMMCQQDITLKIPERVFQTDEGRLPLVDDFEVCNHLVKVFIPATFIIASERTSCIVYFGFVIVHARYQNDCDNVIGPCLFPLIE